VVDRSLMATSCGGSALRPFAVVDRPLVATCCGGSALLLFEPCPLYPRPVPCSEPWPF
jgi:hypothetical protein